MVIRRSQFRDRRPIVNYYRGSINNKQRHGTRLTACCNSHGVRVVVSGQPATSAGSDWYQLIGCVWGVGATFSIPVVGASFTLRTSSISWRVFLFIPPPLSSAGCVSFLVIYFNPFRKKVNQNLARFRRPLPITAHLYFESRWIRLDFSCNTIRCLLG